MREQFEMEIAPLFGQHRRIIYQGSNVIPDNFYPELMEGKYANTLLRQILWRKENNMNTFIFVCGGVRLGKSWFCLKFQELYAQYCKQEYDVKKQVSFTVLPFFHWSRTATDSSFLLDEIQLSMGSREWYNLQHKVFNQFCDIYGYARNVLFMSCPNISFVDKHLRFLINYVVHSKYQGLVEWFKVVSQHHIGKSYLPHMGVYGVSRPTKNTTDIYEQMKDEHNKGKLDNFIEVLENQGKPTTKHLSSYQMQRFYEQGLMEDDEFKEMISVHGIPQEQIDLIIDSKNKIPVKTGYDHVCNKCGNKWTGTSENPRQCPNPKCNTRGWNKA